MGPNCLQKLAADDTIIYYHLFGDGLSRIAFYRVVIPALSFSHIPFFFISSNGLCEVYSRVVDIFSESDNSSEVYDFLP